MNLAAFSVVAFALVVIVGCSPFGSSAADLQPVDSPNGTMTLKLSVNQSKADQTSKNGPLAGSMILQSCSTAATSEPALGDLLKTGLLLSSLTRLRQS